MMIGDAPGPHAFPYWMSLDAAHGANYGRNSDPGTCFLTLTVMLPFIAWRIIILLSRLIKYCRLERVLNSIELVSLAMLYPDYLPTTTAAAASLGTHPLQNSLSP